MIDRELLQYTIKEVTKNINKPYIMSNGALAVELLEELILTFPDIKMVPVGSSQMFYLTDKSKKKIEKIIQTHIQEHKKMIFEYEDNLKELNI